MLITVVCIDSAFFPVYHQPVEDCSLTVESSVRDTVLFIIWFFRLLVCFRVQSQFVSVFGFLEGEGKRVYYRVLSPCLLGLVTLPLPRVTFIDFTGLSCSKLG